MSCSIFLRISLFGITILLLAASCSSGSDSESGTSTSTGGAAAATTAAPVPETTATTDTSPEAVEEASVVVPFSATNGSGTVAVSGDNSPVVAWFGGLPGEVSLDLVDADVGDAVSVVEELVSFWFFQDDDSGDVPPSIFESASDDISDSVGTRYVVEAQGLPSAPVAETTTTTSITSTTTSTTSSVPETSEPPSVTTTSTTTSAAPTTTTVVESPVVLQVQVLNGSGVAGAAGRMTDKLSEAGYVVLSPANAPQRYYTSAVYYQDGWQDKAAEILDVAEIEEIDAPTAMPQIFASEEAAVIVLLGTDTAPAVAREQAGLRPRQRNDVRLPLPDSTLRDRYVPGLANIQIYTRQNEDDPETEPHIVRLADWLRGVSHHANEEYIFGIYPEDRSTREGYLNLLQAIEDELEWLGFTPQNVCGAPAGYSFTDLLQPTREWDDDLKTYGGDAIFTTDRLLELHGGERINPEANLDFYINQAVQTAYDSLRLTELSDEVEAPQMILCDAWKLPSGEIPEAANGYWYALLTPGIQPRESLLSQGTYHVKEISKNGNIAQVVVCHPILGARYLLLHWREAGYRAEYVTSDLVERTSGCQAVYEVETYIYEDTNGAEDTFRFSFGERVFSAGGLSGFPRS